MKKIPLSPFMTRALLVACISILGRELTPAVPTAPTLESPANFASVLVPFTNSWAASTDSDGINSYNWQISASPTFANIIYQQSTFATPVSPQNVTSGLTNGTYYWRVQGVNNASIVGPWSAVQAFTVTGASPEEPDAPTLNPPQGYNTFHPLEGEYWNWTAVAGAATYTFEYSMDPTFSIGPAYNDFNNLASTNVSFAIENPQGEYYMRVRAVNAAGFRSVPSNVQTCTVSDSNPIPPAPEPVYPPDGAVLTLPITFSWTSVPNPQPGGYSIQFAPSPSFSTITEEGTQLTGTNVPLVSIGPGTWYWRVFSQQGDVLTANSATGNFTLSSAAPEVVSFNLTGPNGGPQLARSGAPATVFVQLSTPVSGSNTNVEIASSNPEVLPLPATMAIPDGQAESQLQFTAGEVSSNTTVTITATYNDTSASTNVVILAGVLEAGSTFGTNLGGQPISITLVLTAAPGPNGAVVNLSSSSPAVAVPSTVTIGASNISQAFTFPTAAVTTPTPVTITATLNGVSAEYQGVIMPEEPTSASLSFCPNRLTNTAPFTTTGTLTLTPALPYSASFALTCSDANELEIPGSVEVSAGLTSVSFTLNLQSTAATTNLTFTVTGNGTSSSAIVELNPTNPPSPTLSTVTLNPSTLVGGNNSTGTVTLTGPAPSGGAVVTLGSATLNAATPASVTIPAGETSATFTVTTLQVSFTNGLAIDAQYNCSFADAGLTLIPANPGAQISAFQVNPLSVTGGSSSAGEVILAGPAPSGGAIVSLASGNSAVSMPSSVNVAAGATNASFTITTGSVSATNAVNLTATYQSVAAPAILTLLPGGSGSGPTLASLSLNPTAVVGGNTSQGTVTLTSAAPSGGAVVSLSSGNTAVATVPSSVTVASGATTASFTVTTVSVTATNAVTLTATYNGGTQTAILTVTSAASGPLASLTLNPTSVVGGNSSQGTVSLSAAAPRGGAVVSLSSGNTAVATVPASVTVARGNTSASFTVTTASVTANTSVTVSASYSGGTRTATLTVTPPAAPTLLSLTLNPTSVVGGNSSQGTVTLSGPAPSGGSVANLSSSNTSVATVPSSVTIPAGSTSQTFTVTTQRVNSNTSVTISGLYDGASKSATLTVTSSHNH